MENLEVPKNQFSNLLDDMVTDTENLLNKWHLNDGEVRDKEYASNEVQEECRNSDFDYDKEGYVEVYIDSRCKSSLGKAPRAGFGVYWGNGHLLNASEPVLGEPTNNYAQIQAASRAIRQALVYGVTKLSINTACMYLIDNIAKRIPGSQSHQFGRPVKHMAELKVLYSLLKRIEVKWNYLMEPLIVPGYRLAHDMAKEGSYKYKPRVKRLAN